MSNIKTINWDEIRADYVLNPNYPSFDELAKKYGISKPMILSKANDLEDAVNKGKTWIQQRESYVERKQQVQEDAVINEAKNSVKNFVKVLNNMGLKAFKIVNRELDYIDKVQAQEIAEGRPLSLRKQAKMSDVTKIVEVLQKIAGGEGTKEVLVKVELAGRRADQKEIKLSELSDDDFLQIERQVASGGMQAIDTEFEEVEEK